MSRILSAALVAAGLAFACSADAAIVETTTGGVLTGARAEPRREPTIERQREHSNPDSIGRRDVLVGVGSADEVRRLRDLFAPRETVAT